MLEIGRDNVRNGIQCSQNNAEIIGESESYVAVTIATRPWATGLPALNDLRQPGSGSYGMLLQARYRDHGETSEIEHEL